MINKEDVSYEMDLQENISVKELQKFYEGDVLLWVTGSANIQTREGYYRYVLQYKDAYKYYERKIADVTTNQAYIKGAIDGVKRISRDKRICIISATPLGFEMGFKGKGANGSLIQELCQEIRSKGCKLTEVRYIGHAAELKRFLDQVSGKPIRDYDAENKERKKKERIDWKKSIYVECIDKVLAIVSDKVDEELISQIKKLPDELDA